MTLDLSTITSTLPPTEALRLSEEKFAKAFRISPDAVLISSLADGRILEANDSFLRLTGYTREEVVGRPTNELNVWRSMGDRAALLAALQANHGVVRDMEFAYQTKAGQPGVGLVSAHLIEIAGEQCLITISREITEQKRAAEALIRTAEDLKARNEDLEAFSRTVAHDLKSPLSNIIGFVEWLQSHPDLPAAEQQEYIDIIARNAVKMDAIIDELLLLAQVRKEQVELLPIDTTRLISEAQARLASMIAASGVVMRLPGVWPAALGYGAWVEEVWVNYLSNAIKYGRIPDTAPRLELGFDELPEHFIRFWVRDYGPGIPPEEQADLFTAFGEHSQVRATGHGLGLSIVRMIVEKMGGQVGVESVVGKGSTFFFTLPALE